MAASITASVWGTLLKIQRGLSASGCLPQSCIHTSAVLEGSRHWEMKNRIVYPPQLPGEPRRPAEIYHCRKQIKYSKDKMWYLAKLIQGMSIDQAIAQLEFNDKKGAKIMKEVRDADSFSNKGKYLKRIRYHGRGMFGIMDKVYCHYFVKLVEGPPPPKEEKVTGFQQAKEYVQQLRNRTITHGL
ncbi:hypothetical protein XELAEV_18016911mg [Xenopus laevis]|uniref:Large ribosomal subunit protein uL22m n=1 Tax=Xenopus laevis TaxID=8355 RepID=A0A974HRW7_XENLA|nr:hypothetical protein XELAEV_18016911mg [Xenopus laevis]